MQAMTRRRLGSILLTGSAAALWAEGLVKPAFAADKTHVGILALTSHAPSIIAKAKGYFAAQGLDVDFVSFQAAEPMAVAIASGDVDFGITAITGGLISLADKGAVKVIGGALREKPGIEGQKIIVSKAAFEAGVTTPPKLRGRSFGITTAGSSFQYMAHKIAQKEGFPDEAMHLRPLHQVAAIIAALKSGQIDAWSIVPNIADPLTKSGSAVEIGKISDYVPDYEVTVIFTSTANVTKKQQLVKRFLAAFSKGVDDYDAALVSRSMGAKETADLVSMIHQYVYADQPIEKADSSIRAGAMWISRNARMNLENIEDQLGWFKSEKMVPAEVSMETLVDKSFVETY